MDHNRLTAWTHSLSGLPSRRDVLRALTSAGLGLGVLRHSDLVAARSKKKRKKGKQARSNCTQNCTDRTCGRDGCGGSCGTCGGNQVCHGGNCCTPESRGITCAGRCGTFTNNCGQPVTCSSCPTGQKCLSNGSCAIVCAVNGDCSGGGSTCGCSNPSVEGEKHCIAGQLSPPMSCTSTGDCPPGSHCQNIGILTCVEVCN